LVSHVISELNSSGGGNRSEIYAGGRHKTTCVSNTTYFAHADWLGTERARTDPTGAVAETCQSLPFGDGLSCTGASDISFMHFTGKERDWESGLDNFGARYNSSSLGRFMSPDPLGGKLIDPQTLNKYSYVRNNPINLTDPTGLYTCADQADCKSKQDIAFEKARQQDLKSKDSNVVRAANAYGDPTKDNGVGVQFGDPGNGRDANTTSGLRADPNDPNKIQAAETVTIKSGLSGSALDAAAGHEGSHVADAQDFASTINTQGVFDASKNLSTYQTELKAYMVTQSILSSENTKFGYGDCGLSGPCILGAGIMPAQALQTINQLLANPANRYGAAPNYGVTPANPGPVLYPSLTTPH
jgi:RHS repeat-associated protein